MTKKEALLKISASVWGKTIPTEATELAEFIIQEAEKIGMLPPAYSRELSDEELESSYAAKHSFEGPKEFVKKMRTYSPSIRTYKNEWEV